MNSVNPIDSVSDGSLQKENYKEKILRAAENLIKLRRKREDILGRNLFSDPAWDILLDVYVHRGKGRLVSASDCHLTAPISLGSASRWIGKLQARNLIERKVDSCDRRRIFLDLTPTAILMIEELIRNSGIL